MKEEQMSKVANILKYYGATNQKIKAIEELSELTTALARNINRSDEPKHVTDVIEELADAKIMIRQMELVFGESAVNEVVNQKIEREYVKITGPLFA